MNLEKLLKEREKILKEQEENKYLLLKIGNYSEPFKLRKATTEELVELCTKKLGIEKFNKKEIEKKMQENVAKTVKEISNFLFPLFVEPNFEEEAAELMAKLNVKSKNEIIQSFFEINEMTEVFTILIEDWGNTIEKTKNKTVDLIKKK